MPNFSRTRSCTSCAKAITSPPVAPPWFTSTSACRSWTPTAPFAVAFHPGPVDQPPGGQLHAAFGSGVVRHVGILRKQAFR